MEVLPVIIVLVALFFTSNEAVKTTSNVDFTEVADSADDSGFVNVYRNYPKIQVTVDTSKLKRVSQPESEDSSSGSSGSSGSESVERPTVGVRTDITIEISEESINETNSVDGKTDTGKRNGSNGKKDGKSVDGGDDNASVPVFKGMAGVPTKGKIPKPTSSNDVNSRGPEVTLSSRPTTFLHKNEDRRPAGPYDGWSRFQPVTGVWTTERPYIRRIEYDYHGNPIYVKSYVPYHTQHGHHSDSNGSWKPCYCSVYQQPWDRAPSNPVLPTPTHHRKVNDKVDIPYKQHRD